MRSSNFINNLKRMLGSLEEDVFYEV